MQTVEPTFFLCVCVCVVLSGSPGETFNYSLGTFCKNRLLRTYFSSSSLPVFLTFIRILYAVLFFCCVHPCTVLRLLLDFFFSLSLSSTSSLLVQHLILTPQLSHGWCFFLFVHFPDRLVCASVFVFQLHGSLLFKWYQKSTCGRALSLAVGRLFYAAASLHK